MIVSLVSILVNYLTAYSMMNATGLGHAGLALSTSAVAVFGAVALFFVLGRRVGGVYGRELAVSILKIFLASVVMGGVVWMSSNGIRAAMGSGRVGRLLDLAVSIPLGVVVLCGACKLLRVTELDLAAKAVLGPLLRRFGPKQA